MLVINNYLALTRTHSLHLQCAITDHVLAHEFSELAEEMSLTDGSGELCIFEEEEHGHEEEGEEHGHKGEGLGE